MCPQSIAGPVGPAFRTEPRAGPDGRPGFVVQQRDGAAWRDVSRYEHEADAGAEALRLACVRSALLSGDPD